MTEHELKPCPFCGGEGVVPLAVPTGNTRAERTCCMTDRGECSECGAYIVRAWTEIHDFKGGMKRIDLRSHIYCPNCGAKVTPKCSEITPKVVEE